MSRNKDKAIIERLRGSLVLSHVPRWSIIDTRREQSVANHTYRTAVLADALFRWLKKRGYEVDRGAGVLYAIYHDWDENKTGDIPTPYKRDEDKGIPRSVSIERAFVKLMDTVEAATFLQRYGVRGERIHSDMMHRINEEIGPLWRKWLSEGSVTEDEFRGFIATVVETSTAYE